MNHLYRFGSWSVVHLLIGSACDYDHRAYVNVMKLSYGGTGECLGHSTNTPGMGWPARPCLATRSMSERLAPIHSVFVRNPQHSYVQANAF